MRKKLIAICLFSFMLSGVALLGDLPAAAANTYVFGVADPDNASVSLNPPPIANTQNYSNFYFYYSTEHNGGGHISTGSMKQCQYSSYKNSYAMKLMEPQNAEIDNYINNVWPTLGNNGSNPQFWYKINNLGYACPAGNMAAIIAFQAPQAGEYKFDAQCFGGAKPDQGYVSDKADGVTFSVSRGDNVIWSKNTQKTYADASGANTVPTQTFSLAANEAVYFISDPNNTFDNDLGHWFITVTQLSTVQASTPATSAPATTSTSTNGNTGTQGSVSSAASSSAATGSSQTSSAQSAVSDVSSSSASGTISEADNTVSSIFAEKTAGKQAGATPWIIVGSIAAVLLIGGGIALYFFKFKKIFKKK